MSSSPAVNRLHLELDNLDQTLERLPGPPESYRFVPDPQGHPRAYTVRACVPAARDVRRAVCDVVCACGQARMRGLGKAT
eukprot:1138865-Pelagomonas_calceolata.AAC.3